jgi:hypothetical protein
MALMMMRSLFLLVLTLLTAMPARSELRVALADSLLLPQGRVMGLAWAGTDTLALLVAHGDSLDHDAGDQVFLRVGDLRDQVYWQHDFSGTLARALAWDGEFFWSCGDDLEGGSLLYKIRADTVEIVASYPTPGHRPMALAFDGRWLWLTDRDLARIDRLDPETGDWTRSVAAPGFSPGGLAWDGRSMWVTDAGTGLLTRLQGARLQRQDDVSAEDWFLRGKDILLGHDGRSLWILPPESPYLRRLLLSF